MTPFQQTRQALKARGIELSQAVGEYRLNFRFGQQSTECTTDNLRDALDRGMEMAKGEHPPPPDPPPGPLGSPRLATMKAKRIRHNHSVLANRKKKKEAAIEAEITAKVTRTT
jgi:hypothetical protein